MSKCAHCTTTSYDVIKKLYVINSIAIVNYDSQMIDPDIYYFSCQTKKIYKTSSLGIPSLINTDINIRFTTIQTIKTITLPFRVSTNYELRNNIPSSDMAIFNPNTGFLADENGNELTSNSVIYHGHKIVCLENGSCILDCISNKPCLKLYNNGEFIKKDCIFSYTWKP